MAGNYRYPGVYVEEIPSGVRTIAGVSTSDTAFIGFFARGPVDEATRITSFGDFQRIFGGLDRRSEASYGIQQFYINGGSVAWVVRVVSDSATIAKTTLKGDDQAVLEVAAASEGLWGNNVQVAVDHNVANPGQEFNLVAREVIEEDGKLRVVASEVYRNLTMDQTSAKFAIDVVNARSQLVKLDDAGAVGLPEAAGADVIGAVGDPDDASFRYLGREYPGLAAGEYEAGSDGTEPDADAWKQAEGANKILGGADGETDKKGMYALDKIAPNIFNIMCIPGAANLSAASLFTVYSAANAYCLKRRAFLIVDIPEDKDTVSSMIEWLNAGSNSLDGLRNDHAAVYFPRLVIADRLNENRSRNVAASGTLAGVYARTDATRGVWKAPAGTDATLRNVVKLAAKINDEENGGLNPFGLNALRSFPIYGNVGWGARTLDGADMKASEYKYIPVRRTALYIEEALYQGLKWVVFEPNDERLWAQIRLNVGAFMNNLFRQGAFQGASPREAYFVKCDSETTTQNDIDLGVVNIVVGFAPLKPAEFVVIKIQQIAGALEV